jgi:malonyl-CoA O-methyltransferase
MRSSRSTAVAESFGASADNYDAHAELQRAVAARLVRLLPELVRPRVLELGCGTGLFSRHLLAHYPDGTFVFSDLAPAMVEQCRRRLDPVPRASFAVIDADAPDGQGTFDLIALSMALHWLLNPLGALQRLRRMLSPRGALVYATLGRESFAEWRGVLEAEALPSGLVEIPTLPGVVAEERLVPDGGALGFLRGMQAIGGLTPRAGYRPLAPGALRRAIRALDAHHGGRVTWHIVYGRLGSDV